MEKLTVTERTGASVAVECGGGIVIPACGVGGVLRATLERLRSRECKPLANVVVGVVLLCQLFDICIDVRLSVSDPGGCDDGLARSI